MTAVIVAPQPGAADVSDGANLLGHTLNLPAGAPRALLCAVHGRGMTGAYFSTHTDDAATLTAVALDAGFAVLVPDRPGYGSSVNQPSVSLVAQALAVEQVITSHLAVLGGSLPVFLAGHSLGGRVALEIAATGRIPVTGLEIAAAGHRLRDGVDPDRSGAPGEAWGPPACYPPGLFALARAVVADVPAGEVVADSAWSAQFITAAAQVRCPVRIAWAQHDRWWRRDASEATAVTAAFPLAPSVTTSTLLAAGHNLHLGVHARQHNQLTLEFLSSALEMKA